FVICDIITEKYEEVNRFVIDEMDHSTTLFDTVGGYTGEDRKMVRAVIYTDETTELREFIATIDPKAFVSFTKAKTINGEGFEPFYVRHRKKHSKTQNSQQNQTENEVNNDGD
ncbi:MAG: YitT family protein, partial [Bacilli bacterium]|nr:YitT family protein [Bacilli bacterium]